LVPVGLTKDHLKRAGGSAGDIVALCPPHHAEGLVDPNRLEYKMKTDFGYPRACRFRKYHIENRLWELPLPTFFKTLFLLYKIWLKLAKMDQKWNFSILIF
jgi:hypothetical protein